MSKINIEVSRIQRVGGQTLLGVIFNCPASVQVLGAQIIAEFFVDGKTSRVPDPFNPQISMGFDGNMIINVAVNEIWPAEYTDFGIYRVEIYWQDMEDQSDHSDLLIVSDVEFSYHCMVSQLVKMGDCCADIPNEVIQAYLMLFAHQQSMLYKDFTKAKYFYKKLIQLCKGRCYTSSPCNCK